MIFYGQHYHSLDDKGRVIIPSLFRDIAFSEGEERTFVLTLASGEDKNLYMLPLKEWAKKVEAFNKLQTLGPQLKNHYRFFFGMAHVAELDRHNRISIPDYLKEKTGFEKDIVFVGVNKHIEIWSSSNWQEFSRQNHQDLDPLTQILYQG